MKHFRHFAKIPTPSTQLSLTSSSDDKTPWSGPFTGFLNDGPIHVVSDA